jgi:hypothetical protein
MNKRIPPAWVEPIRKHGNDIYVICLRDYPVASPRISETTIEFFGRKYQRLEGTIESALVTEVEKQQVLCRSKRGLPLQGNAPHRSRVIAGEICLCREYNCTKLVVFVLPDERI